jgi:hypothetical protein
LEQAILRELPGKVYPQARSLLGHPLEREPPQPVIDLPVPGEAKEDADGEYPLADQPHQKKRKKSR